MQTQHQNRIRNKSIALRTIRDQRGMSLQQVSHATGVSEATILLWEEDDLIASPGDLKALSQALGIPEQDLKKEVDFWDQKQPQAQAASACSSTT